MKRSGEVFGGPRLAAMLRKSLKSTRDKAEGLKSDPRPSWLRNQKVSPRGGYGRRGVKQAGRKGGYLDFEGGDGWSLTSL